MNRTPRRDVGPAWFTAAAWASGALVTAWILWGPYIFFAYRNASARLVSETVVLCVALLGALLAHGRLVRARRVQDLVLAQGLIVLALATWPASGLVARWLPGEPGTTDMWLASTLHLTGTAFLLAAAVVHRRSVVPRITRRAARALTLLVPLTVVTALAVLFLVVGDTLPLAADITFGRAELQPDLLTAHPAMVVIQLLSCLCFLAGSVAWTVKAQRTHDALVTWLGAACALGGFGRLIYALTPSLYTEWFYAGDLLRLACYLLLLAGSARELSSYWTARTVSAVLEDRRRLAGELHDGVVQELTYIRGEAHRIDEDPELRERLLSATDRALDESRAAIQALTRLDGEPLVASLRRTARELGRRHGITVDVSAPEHVEVDADQLHTLLRIVREAVTNAARHGLAETVRIELEDGEGVRVLRVRDDGSGFDPQTVTEASSGYGLVSMGERARSLPGTLEVRSRMGAGSEVRVTW